MKICILAFRLENIVSCQISYEVKKMHRSDSRKECAVLEDLILRTHSAECALAFCKTKKKQIWVGNNTFFTATLEGCWQFCSRMIRAF